MRKLLIFITTLLILQGCNFKGTYSREQLQKLTNSAYIDQLEKAEFDIKENKLIIFTEEEVISENDFNKLLATLKLNSFSGKKLGINEIDTKEFENKKFKIEIASVNKNTVLFSTDDVSSKEYSIVNTRYSKGYIKNKQSLLSKKLVTLDSLAGVIETALSKGREVDEKVTEFRHVKEKIDYDISTLKELSADNVDYANLDELKKKLERLAVLTNGVVNAVELAISSKNPANISGVFLYINDIDKLARELEVM